MSQLRTILALLALIFIPDFLFAQTSGRITDSSTNSGIEGAVVTANGTFLQSITDADGKFYFKVTVDSVTVTHISYQPAKVSLAGNNEIKLNRKTYLSEEVTISSTRADEKSAIAYSNVDKAELEKQNNGRDFPFLMNSLPSVVVTSDAGAGVGYTGIRIRGSDATRVNVTINGVPVNDAESHQVYWVDLPDIASSVENVQVQRGIGNSTNGAGAFGGSVNILTNKLNAKPFATIASSAGSFNTFKNTISFGSGLFAKSFAVEGRLSKITSDGYIDRATSDLKSAYLSAGYYGKKNSLRTIFFTGKEKTYQAWYGVPQDSLETNRTYNPAGEYYDADGNVHYYDNQTDNYRQDYYQLHYSHEFNERVKFNSAFYYTHGSGYYEEYSAGDDLMSYGLSDTSFTADVIRQKWLSNDLYGSNLSVEFNSGKSKLQAGISGNYYEGDHFGKVISVGGVSISDHPHEYYEDMAYKGDVSIFAREVYSINRNFNFTIDLQQRMVSYAYLGFDDSLLPARQEDKLNFFNPKAGINYNLTEDFQIYLFAGIGEKEPVRDDFVNAAPTDNLTSEKLLDIEGGIKAHKKNIMYELNLFHMKYDNQLILTGKINDVGEYIRQNVPNSHRTGVEASVTYKFTNKFYGKANATYSNNRIKLYKEYVDDYDQGTQVLSEYKNTPIAFSPDVTGYAALGYGNGAGPSVELSGKYVGKQYLDNTGSDLRKIDDYFVADLHISYTFLPKKIKELTFRVSIFNLADTKYSSNGYSYSGYIGGVRNDFNFYFPQAGRSFSGGVVLKF